MTEKRRKLFMDGCFLDPKDNRDYKIKNVLRAPIETKNKIVNYGPEMGTARNQGHKGSCVGFAVAAVLEWQQKQEYLNERSKGSTYKRDSEEYDLSEQWIYHKAKEIDEWEGEGTSIRYAMKIINRIGVPSEKGWPYSDLIVGKPEFWAYSTARWNRNKKYYRIETLDELKQTLIKVGPCVIGVYVFDEFYSPDKNGHIRDPKNPNNILGGHALCAIGFDDRPHKQNKLIIRNSWGEGWGKRGHGSLSYDFIEKYMMDAWVTIDEKVESL